MTLAMKLCACCIGIFMVYIAVRSVVKRTLSARQSLFWIFSGLFVVVCSLIPDIIFFVADLFGAAYAPTIFLFLAVGILGVGSFYCFERISKMRQELRDIAIHLTLLNEENIKLRKMLGIEDGRSSDKTDKAE